MGENFKRNDTHFNEVIDESNQIVFNNIISRYFKLNDLSLNKLNLIEYKNRGEKLIVGDGLTELNHLKNFIFNRMRKLTKNIGNKQYNSNEQDQEIENSLRNNLINTMFLYGIPSNNITIPFLLHFDEARKIIKKMGFNTPMGMTSVLEFKDTFDIEDNLKLELIRNNDINKVLMTWSENTIEMFNFKEGSLNKFEFLFLIQWILYGMEEPDYEKLDNIYSDYLEEYFHAFHKGVILSINNVREKFNLFENSDVMEEIIELRNKVKNLKIKNMKIIFSHDYIFTRFIGLPSFVPFKYWKNVNPETNEFDKGKCNNGSLCCESKLFSYIFDKYNVKSLTEIIKGETCYWMSDKDDGELHEDETAKSYSFVQDNGNEELARQVMCQIIDINEREQENLNLSKRFAVPCPGCQTNYFNYLKNKRISWSKKEECFEELKKFYKLKDAINGEFEVFLQNKSK